jgi:hypothetical protein
MRHREGDFDLCYCMSQIFPPVTSVHYILFTDPSSPAAFAHMPVLRLGPAGDTQYVHNFAHRKHNWMMFLDLR